MIAETETITERATKFRAAAELFCRDANGDRADGVVEERVDKRCQAFVAAGWPQPPDHIREEVDLEERTAYDRRLSDAQNQIDQTWRQLEQEWRDRITAAAEVGPEPGTDGGSDQTRLLATMLAGNQKAAAVTQLTGRTVGYVHTEYVNTPDTKDREKVKMIEHQIDRSFADLRLVPDRSDAEELLALRAAIRARRNARIEANDPEAYALGGELAALRGQVVLETLLAHVRSGRGIAKRPTRRTVRW